MTNSSGFSEAAHLERDSRTILYVDFENPRMAFDRKYNDFDKSQGYLKIIGLYI